MPDPSGLPPEQEAVRRLLADARHDESTPPEVVARLDDTLASLVAERGADATASSSPGRIVDIGSRRRRRAGIGLLAAASVVVAGVAIGQALPRVGSDDASAGSSSESSIAGAPAPSRDPSARDSAGGSADDGADDGAGAAESAPESLKSGGATAFAGRPTLASADSRLDDELLALRPQASARHRVVGSPDAVDGCDLPDLGRGRRLLVEVDGQPGVVVFRRPDGAAQQAEVYVCGITDPVRTLTLPAP
ncbi:hypothetical protein [Nocardioides sp. zg-1228]|uniref:hypothetical protein n=1 Tax=Nocardioides sp. zg-1228 TaxID=2763008 RepID=UPI001642ABC0|nr:hypothetical protein [Nocardioides sp. zg-1228]MBC2932125.1 hypothetical protein [Nocardioides sp. zg-1228]QSF57668.1 hypothetical protein JX575_19455 [Nocardioides sp. zg-1228]